MIRGIISLHNAVFGALQRLTSGWLLGLAARLIFGSATLVYFWNSAKTKICAKDWTAPGQPTVCDPFSPTAGAYGQILPGRFEEVGADVSQLGLMDHLIVYGGTYAEFVIPLLVVIGLFTRLSSLAMIGFLAVMTYVDLTGHGATLGGFFDRNASDLIADQRLLWFFPLLYLALRGPGMISVDGVLCFFLGEHDDRE